MRRPALIQSVQQLVDQLRREGYNVGLEHYLAAQELLLALVARNQLPEQPEKLRRLLAPLLCSTPLEQRDFPGHFQRWAATQYPATRPQIRPEPVPPRRRQLLKVAASLLVLAASLVFVLLPEPEAPEIGQDLAEGTEPSVGRDTEEQAGSEGDPSDKTVPSDPPARLKAAVDAINRRHGEDVPKEKAWKAFYRDHFNYMRNGLALLPLVSFFFWQIWKSGSRPLLLERRSIRADPRLEPVRIRGPSELLFRTSSSRRTVQNMRRHRERDSTELDALSTARASARLAGLFTPVYASRLVTPEYLALIDRPRPQDQQSQLVEQLIRRLQEGGVFIERYYFDGDPSFCGGQDLTERFLPLQDLASRHRGQILLLFSDGRGLVDAGTGRPKRHLELLPSWKERVLLTPEPVGQWGHREMTLAEWGFAVLPASLAGLEAYLSNLHTGVPAARSRAGRWTPPYPELLREWPEQWLDKTPPEAPFIDQVCRDLRLYLDEVGFEWLCACAVYPELDWHLTLRLGSEIRQDGKPLLEEERLAALARLPWFRFGSMPDWLRLRLLDELGEERQSAVRESLNRILATGAGPEEPGFNLKIAVQGLPPPLWRKFFGRKESGSSPLRDHVFLSAMLGRKPPPRLALAAPDFLRRLLYRQGHSLLGMRPILGLVLTALAGWACLVGIPPPAPAESAFPRFQIASMGQPLPYASSEERLIDYYRRFFNLCTNHPGSLAAAFCADQKRALWDGEADSIVNPFEQDRSLWLYLSWLQADLVTAAYRYEIELAGSPPGSEAAESTLLGSPEPGKPETRRLAQPQNLAPDQPIYLSLASPEVFAGTFEGIYHGLLSGSRAPDISFDLWYGRQAALRNRKTIRGAFTRRGWVAVQAALTDPNGLSSEDWVRRRVAQSGEDIQNLEARLRQRYVSDYIEEWKGFLQDTLVYGYVHAQDAASKLSRTADARSPLLALLWLAATHTSAGPQEAVIAFQPVSQMVPPGEEGAYIASNNRGYVQALLGLQSAWDALGQVIGDQKFLPPATDPSLIAGIRSAADSAEAVAKQVALDFKGDRAGRVSSRVKRIIEAPIRSTRSLLNRLSELPLDAGGAGFCAAFDPLWKKYPFDPNSSQEATLQELAAVFAPGQGALWKFHDEMLKEHLVKQGNSYQPKPGDSIQLRDDFVRFFNQAARVSQTFFAQGQPQPMMAYTVTPQPIDTMDELDFQVGNETLISYRNGGSPVRLTWPKRNNQVRLTMTRRRVPLTIPWDDGDSPWSIFRFFFDAASVPPSGSGIYEWRPELLGRPVRGEGDRPVVISYHLDHGGGDAPVLKKGYLAGLSCVAKVHAGE